MSPYNQGNIVPPEEVVINVLTTRWYCHLQSKDLSPLFVIQVPSFHFGGCNALFCI